MYAVQNRIDGLYLTARGFSGNGPAWGEERDAATFETREEAEAHRKTCEVETVTKIVEVE